MTNLSHNNSEIMISVIMPAYNAEPYIKQAIESILLQSYKNFELIIVNDGSSDRTRDIVLSFTDHRIRLIDNDGNKGIVYSLNRGVKEASGKYIARMDSDDISLPERFEKQLEYIVKNKLDLIGCMTKRIDMQENCIISIANKSYSPDIIKRCLKYDCCIAHPTWLAKKIVFQKLNGYREMRACEDYDFLLRTIKSNFKVGICDSVQLLYRENTKGISSSNIFRQRLSAQYLRDNFKSIEEITPFSVNDYINKSLTDLDGEKYRIGAMYFDKGIQNLNRLNPLGLFQILKGLNKSKLLKKRLNNLIKLHLVRIGIIK